MKRVLKCFLCLILVLVVALCAASCGSSKDYFYKNNTKDYVYKCGEFVVEKNFYTYWLARYKAILMYTYSDIKDTDEYWDSQQGDSTINDIMTAYADNTVKNYIASLYLFNKFTLDLGTSKVANVEEQLSEILEDGYDGNVANLNKEAYQYGINYDMLRQIYIAEAKTEAVYSYLTSQVLKNKLTDELRASYLNENYAHTTHIFVGTEYAYNLDKDGNVIYDSNGNYTTALTDEQKKDKLAKIAELDAISLSTDNFAEYQGKYNEDPSLKNYKNGYFVSTNNNYDAAYVTTALTMKPGEIKKVEGNQGVYYILKQEMPQKAYSDTANSDFFDKYDNHILDYLYWEYMDDIYAEIEVNEEIKKTVSIKTVEPCWYF